MTDAQEIARALSTRIEALARDLLPAAKLHGQLLRCGGVDGAAGESLAVNLRGPRAGRWCDYATGEHGDALDLIRAVRRCDTREAIVWARAWLGLDAYATRHEPAPATAARPSSAPSDDFEARRARAKALFLRAVPIEGTPAESYLLARGIVSAALRSTRALRFVPALRHAESGRTLPALVAAIAALDGETIGVHRTWLARGADGLWRKAPLRNAKMSLGSVAGGAIRLSSGAGARKLREADPAEPVVIGEGIETCLSVAIACPELRVLCAVSLANLGAVALPSQVRSVILAADNDEAPGARRGLARAIEAHRAAGREVRVARSPIGKDFNDVATAFLGSAA